jgi:hypothetical protein
MFTIVWALTCYIVLLIILEYIDGLKRHVDSFFFVFFVFVSCPSYIPAYLPVGYGFVLGKI